MRREGWKMYLHTHHDQRRIIQSNLCQKSFSLHRTWHNLTRIPKHLLKQDDPVFEFNRQIIEATKEFCVAFKPNLAFYESQGPAGLTSLEKTMGCIPESVFTIADETWWYWEYFRNVCPHILRLLSFWFCDSGAVHGKKIRWVHFYVRANGWFSSPLKQCRINGFSIKWDVFSCFRQRREIVWTCFTNFTKWADAGQMMYVIGATHPELLNTVRSIVPDHFLLVPGSRNTGEVLRKWLMPD